MNIDPAAILAVISDLSLRLAGAEKEVADLREQLRRLTKGAKSE